MKRILLGGSPCTHWSIAQSKNRETTASGLGWELFKNYVIAKEKFKPDFFLYENNYSISEEIKKQIENSLGVKHAVLNSALVSGQQRKRIYYTNLGENIIQPKDRGIVVNDILGTGKTNNENNSKQLFFNEKLEIVEKEEFEPIRVGSFPKADGRITNSQGYRIYSVHGKSGTMLTGDKDVGLFPIRIGTYPKKNGELSKSQGYAICSVYGKSPTALQKQEKLGWYPIRVGEYPKKSGELSKSQANRVYSEYGKSINLCANGGGGGAKTGLYAIKKEQINKKEEEVYKVKNGIITIRERQYNIKLDDGYYIIRKLTPVEAERLQTMPDNYTQGISDTQRYKCLGNGWTAEIIIHILKQLLVDVPRDEELQVLSMYDGIATGRYCLEKLGFTNIKYYAYEIDKFAIQIAKKNYPDILELGDCFQVRQEDWGLL